jgi:hypothetical protein
VKVHLRSVLLPLAVAAAVLVAPLAALAQAPKPVAIVSIASVKEQLADVGYLTRTAGMEDAGKSAMFFANALTAGLEKEKPIGLYVVPQPGDLHAIAFLPVRDLKTLLEVQKEYLGTPKDVGNGILEIGTDRKAFLKEQAGWAFVAVSQEHLANLPPDPTAVLGDLPAKYNVAIKLLVQNIPQEQRQLAIDQVKIGMERGLAAQRGQRANFDRQATEQVMKVWMANLERLINETEEVLIGLGVDSNEKHTILEIGITAKEGTALARQAALQQDAKTQFGGFLLPDAAVTMTAVSRTTPEDLAQIGPAMKASREMWSKQIDDAPGVPADKRDAAKRVMGEFMDVIEKTAATGRGDFGLAVVLLPKSLSFALGGYIADGAAMEKALKDGLELAKSLAKDQAGGPQVEFNVGTHGQIRLHRLTAEIPNREPEARELLGDKLEILVGVGPQSFFVSGGKDAEALLKNIVDRSAAEPNKAVLPLQLDVAMLPILKFYKSVDDNPIVNDLIGTLEQVGNDHLLVTVEPGPRSSRTRIELQEGLIKAAGGAAKAAGAGPRINARN